MPLSVGTNWDRTLLAALPSLPEVQDLFGSLPRHVVGHGRPYENVPKVTREEVAAHVAELHVLGRRFTYLLNAPGMGGREFRVEERRGILEHLEWLAAIGVDAVTVAIPDLLETIVARHPLIRVKVSHMGLVNSVEQVKVWQGMGAQVITLHASIYRDFRLLERMVRAATIPLQVICTGCCVRGCPNRISYHGCATAQLSSPRAEPNEHNRHATGYCFSWCHLKKMEHPEYMVKAGIRPEDMHLFEEVGIRHFKLDTRVMKTAQVVDRARAYSDRRWDGDLKRLLSVFSLGYRTRVGSQMGGGGGEGGPADPAARYFAVAHEVAFDRLLRVDSQKLDGLLARVTRTGCATGTCDGCDVCTEYAGAAMHWDEAERARLKEILAEYHRWLVERE